ncbi:hypothetical protein VTO42DRAFT_8693 [Malbranchea cinnamomea]
MPLVPPLGALSEPSLLHQSRLDSATPVTFAHHVVPQPLQVSSHMSLPLLILLVVEAVLEVVCVSLPGYLVALWGMFDAEAQKFVANLNVTLFTPCLIFTKLASQLSAGKLSELAIIPFIFVVQTSVSYLSSVFIARCFRFRRRQSNFVTAMGVFGNSNSLPISLVISLSKTLSGLHWERIPNDNDDQVAARGILYLLIFQQLGQLLRWSWGYRVLLAPRDAYLRDEEERARARLNPDQDPYSDHPGLDDDHTVVGSSSSADGRTPPHISPGSACDSGGHTPVEPQSPSIKRPPSRRGSEAAADVVLPPPLAWPAGAFVARQHTGQMFRFPDLEPREEQPLKSPGLTGWVRRGRESTRHFLAGARQRVGAQLDRAFAALPRPIQRAGRAVGRYLKRFVGGLWDFMNPPLWAMFLAIIVASVPSLQRAFFTPGTFLSNSVTRAIEQSGGVAVPLILVVLGANLERSTLPQGTSDDHEDPKEERKLVVASLLARMLFPTLIMGPLLAITAKYVPVSILDDPIFIIICFLLTGAPSALQLAQICQINNVYMGAMAHLLFQSYVIWIFPSTLTLVVCALKVVEWATL